MPALPMPSDPSSVRARAWIQNSPARAPTSWNCFGARQRRRPWPAYRSLCPYRRWRGGGRFAARGPVATALLLAYLLGSPRGLSSRSGGGSSRCGHDCRPPRHRSIATAPTDVLVGAVVAGKGPPCCIAWVTATPGAGLRVLRCAARRCHHHQPRRFRRYASAGLRPADWTVRGTSHEGCWPLWHGAGPSCRRTAW